MICTKRRSLFLATSSVYVSLSGWHGLSPAYELTCTALPLKTLLQVLYAALVSQVCLQMAAHEGSSVFLQVCHPDFHQTDPVDACLAQLITSSCLSEGLYMVCQVITTYFVLDSHPGHSDLALGRRHTGKCSTQYRLFASSVWHSTMRNRGSICSR